MRRERSYGICVTLTLCIWSADVAAQRLDRRVRIVNDSKQDIVSFYAVNVRADAAEDRLADADLPPGGAVILDFDDGSGYCRFSFRAVFKDGVELTRDSVNICEVGTYRYTE